MPGPGDIILSVLLDALSMAFGMTWKILRALILGFTLSGVVQAVVSKGEMTTLFPDDSPISGIKKPENV